MEETSDQIGFIRKELIPKIVRLNDDLAKSDILSCTVKRSDHMDGFMSAIFMVKLVTRDEALGTKSHDIIVKLMKGDEQFRTATKSHNISTNEIYVYDKVLSYFQKFLTANGVKSFKATDWYPRLYYCEVSNQTSLSAMTETILALENISPSGYRSGPRVDLDEKHLWLMTKKIAQYHSLTYALRITKDPELERLRAGIIPLTFVEANGQSNLYNVVYDVALERFFHYLDKTPRHMTDPTFVRDITNLRTKFKDNPVLLLEKFRRIDETFSVILHGDYNRNNILFKYSSAEGFDDPVDMKMFDFQELRYGTPAMDLSFYMYMNMPPHLFPLWDALLKYYHDTVMASLMEILMCPASDARLEPYSYDKFLDHFAQFGFYGGMVAIHFLPWMTCSEEECNAISHVFETDMYDPKFRELVMAAGGEYPSERIIAVAKHASQKGYLKILEDF